MVLDFGYPGNVGTERVAEMTLRERAESAATVVVKALAASPTEDQAKKVTELIEQAVIDALLEEAGRCADVARKCCAADRDLAHKVAREITNSNVALIANLSSLR